MQHKEAMKQLKTNVDVLTLTATPIPRTLEMSLVGIRDLSLLQTPPADRQPILTYVGGYDERVAVEAIRRELLREGQVFWVHNRVQHDRARPPPACASSCPRRASPSPTGRWTRARSSRSSSTSGRASYDVLVCTTIIESGIDMPTVNTLVVERSDLLGLGQLHQLRGRVGRSGQRAYAYLFHPADVALTEEAYERLQTIGEATELGSGFKIAMRDLEIRGAGNLLGEAQSRPHRRRRLRPLLPDGHRGGRRDEGRAGPDAGRDQARRADRRLPADGLRRQGGAAPRGVPAAGRRSRPPAEVDDIRAEWEDRYGPLPAAAEALLDVGVAARRVPPPRPHATSRSRRDQARLGAARAQARASRRGCGGWPATRSTRRTPASSSCRSRAARAGRVPRRVPPRADPAPDAAWAAKLWVDR